MRRLLCRSEPDAEALAKHLGRTEQLRRLLRATREREHSG
jgi:hypothetical protein